MAASAVAAARTARRLVLAGLMLAAAAALAAAANYPALTGRVVDGANVIPADARGALTARLADLEAKSGIQLVVATVASLDGQEIEPYANELFRIWGLGQKTKNNGVLLLVAPNERRVRIEVGYGLEGTLTDALSKVIIVNAITPRFKAGDFGGGVSRGVDDIITVLTTDASEWQARPSLRLDSRKDNDSRIALALMIFFVIMLVVFSLPVVRQHFAGPPQHGRRRSHDGGWTMGGESPSTGGSSFSSSDFGGGGGFSGGGGSSGGGGASGSW
ncbi:MAG TPA: TPM domain-containing protein [Pseudolabrys sp.]|nr:TPM domain-containing protein [Pseudolabrys sp.]